jgi:hypothetical protein
VNPEQYKRMTSDQIARLLREFRGYRILRLGEDGNDICIIKRV